jgi:hypothetical protein
MCVFLSKCSVDLGFGIIHILYAQPVHIYGPELWDEKDIFVNPLNILFMPGDT